MDKHYLLVKRGLYYRPDRAGYTGIKDEAGRYNKSDDEGLSGVIAVHEDDAPDKSEGCWDDLWLKHRLKKQEDQSHALITKLIGYAGHDSSCAIDCWSSDADCTCGYSDTLAEARKFMESGE